MPKLQEKPSPLKREHPVLTKHENSGLFSIFVGHFCPPGSGPDPATQINADPCGSRSETLEKADITHIHMRKACREFS